MSPDTGDRVLEDGRREQLSILTAIETVLADPVRLIGLLQDAADDEDALRRVRQEFDLDRVHAEAVIDVQFRRVNRADRARIAEELRLLRAAWGSPSEASVRFTSRRSAVLSLDGAEHPFRAGGAQGVLDLVSEFVVAEVARPRLRPVVVTVTGLPGGPARMTLTPVGDGHYEYADDPVAPEAAG
jgi:hypothetical protein